MTPATFRDSPPGSDFYVRVTPIAAMDDHGFIACAIADKPGLLPRNYHASALECVAPPVPRPLKAGDYIVNLSSGAAGRLEAVFGHQALVSGFSKNEVGLGPLADYRRATTAEILDAHITSGPTAAVPPARRH